MTLSFKQLEIDNWIYSVDRGADGQVAFSIKPNLPNYKEPEQLYKLYSLTDYAIDALKDSYIYAPHPCQLNDLYDCHEDLIAQDDPNFPERFLTMLYGEENKTLENKQYAKKWSHLHVREWLFRKLAPISLTNNPNNPLMWAYYNNNAGFGIELSLAELKDKFHGPFPIHYREKIEPISLLKHDWPLCMLYQTNIKSRLWDHEKEFRLLLEKPTDMKSPPCSSYHEAPGEERNLYYTPEGVKKVLFGNRFFDPWELQELNDSTLEVTISKKELLKNELLNVCIDKDYTVGLAQRERDLMSLTFRLKRIQLIRESLQSVVYHLLAEG